MEAGSSVPVDVARQRELKWLEMFAHWDKWLSRRYQKVRGLRCRKGIPSSLRAKAWQLLSNSKELLERNPGRFEELERQPGDPKWLDVIEKDLHRQFPFHEMFAAPVQLDGEVFGALLRRAAPAAHRHLRRFRVDPVLYLTEWFMCIFARSLPWAAVLRVWDMFFCEGVKIMFRVGLVLLRRALGSPEKLRSCQGLYETLERL
uniref:Rab-GAP TBC domain-containing protein n=1 Tax=Apteryx owenii TaxID=8824 RepID=A0A8B9PE58_APTOW